MSMFGQMCKKAYKKETGDIFVRLNQKMSAKSELWKMLKEWSIAIVVKWGYLKNEQSKTLWAQKLTPTKRRGKVQKGGSLVR